ncbi:hypothetical protein CHUAL_012570 [Chamberlinius hualienensis]
MNVYTEKMDSTIKQENVIESKNESDSFLKMIRGTIFINEIHGFNILQRNKSKHIYNILYAHTIILMLYYLFYAILKADFQNDDVQKTIATIFHVSLAFCLLGICIHQRSQLGNLVKMFQLANDLFDQLEVKKQVLSTLKPRLFIATKISPSFVFLLYYLDLLERYFAGERSIKYGQPYFKILAEKYHLNLIYGVWGGLAPVIFGSIAYQTLGTVSALVDSIFQYLENVKRHEFCSPPKNSIETIATFIKIHRRSCQLLKLADETFSPISLMIYAVFIVGQLSRARNIVNENSSFSIANIAAIIFFMILLTAIVKRMSTARLDVSVNFY